MREAWMALPNVPVVLKGWIEMTAKNLGLLNYVENILCFLVKFNTLYVIYGYVTWLFMLYDNGCFVMAMFIINNDEKILLVVVMYLYIRFFWKRGLKRKRDNDSAMTGHKYTLELLQGNPKQCIELLRMSRESFVRLCAHFRTNYSLKDSKHVSVEEKMAMFFMIIGHNQRYVVIKRRFQHSKQTIHKFFHEVLDKMMLFAKDMIVPTSFNPNPNIPGHNKRLQKIFKGAVGALDGTLIHAVVPTRQQDLYRGRGKGDCYQNEGVAHDSRILSEALLDPHAPFPFPPSEKYYLCDAAYAHI
ncbi:uncharacterized protein LOC143566217 [Bidens hawaiensis]|uniref:uncharacterized protein LOC143566217 n=1 Tax=Bidens hawaiensis TaxID=980011 RepID=UPI00404B890F